MVKLLCVNREIKAREKINYKQKKREIKAKEETS